MYAETSKEILKSELVHRITSNSAYSMRAMARQIKVSSSLLSDLLSGKKRLSSERAFEIAKLLKFSKKKSEYFSTLVQYESAKSEDLKVLLAEKLNALHEHPGPRALDLDIFKTISEWYHLPILELTHIKGFKLTSEAAAKSLGISKHEADLAISRLIRLKLLERTSDERIVKTDNRILASSSLPNLALRKFHEQMLQKAVNSLSEQTPEEKFVGSETFVFDQKQLAEANEAIEECFSKILNISKKIKNKSSVYHFGVQFFRLTAKE
jgi:uncharacterized protein (TIGR02147 family)